jgi:DNA-binding MltR family transcriptional regulator
MSKPELFDHLDRYNRVADLFDKESDRAAAILAASYLETLLEKLLRATFVRTPSTDMFSSRGPLSTFASRTDLAYALGLFHEGVYHDLTLIRRVRNDFAHNFDDATFSLPAVKDRCADLWFVKQLATHQDVAALSQRDRFLLSVGHATLAVTQPLHREWIDRGRTRE